VTDLAGNTATKTVTVTVQGVVEAIGSGIFKGTNNNDSLQGSSAVDKLHGLNGNDLLIGGGGKDMLQGGAGNDEFRFDRLSDFGDAIYDFQTGGAADKVSLNVGVGDIEIGNNDTTIDANEILFIADKTVTKAQIDAYFAGDSAGHLIVARMSDTNAATVWYDAPGATLPVMVAELINIRSVKDISEMGNGDFLFF
jgi:Ca2+-binding RTX toxin-like protein